MARFACPLPRALSDAFARLRDPRAANPAWMPQLRSEALGPLGIDAAQRELVERALVAPVVALLSVTSGGQEEIRLAIDGDGAILIELRAEDECRWSEIPLDAIDARIASLLPAESPLSAPPRMTARGAHNELRVDAAQRARIAERLEAGAAPADAIAEQDDLEPRIRDALLSPGDRAAFDLSMYVPPREGAALLRFHLLRRWKAGELGLYSADGDDLLDGMHEVEPGDVLGTVLPLLEEGIALAIGSGAAA